MGSETPPDASRSPSPIIQADYGTWRYLRPANFSPQPSVTESPRPTPPPPEQSTLTRYPEEYQSQSDGSTPHPVSASLRPGGPAPLLPVLVRPPSPAYSHVGQLQINPSNRTLYFIPLSRRRGSTHPMTPQALAHPMPIAPLPTQRSLQFLQPKR
jgi:hypothetical protein